MAEKHKRDSRADPAELAAKEQEVSDGIATLLTLSDGTYRMTELRLGEPNKRYWEVDESGGIVWKAHRETVNIPDGVSVIGALHCPILGSVVIPPSVRELDDLAFGIEHYSGDTLSWYALHTVIFSQGLRRIGYRAFYNCRELDGVRLPKGLERIEEDAFCLCRSLSDITVPESVDGIGYRAFGYCNSLEKAVFRDGCTWLGGYAFAYCHQLETVILPKTLISIGPKCFLNCESLEYIDLPESVEKIHEGAFENCLSLREFTFKRNLENGDILLSDSPFKGCGELTVFNLESGVTTVDWLPSAPELREIRVASSHPLFTTVDGALYSGDKKTLLRVPSGKSGEFTVPRGVTAIAPHAFHECMDITAVNLPSTLVTIGDRAFHRCYGLVSIELTGKVKSIGSEAFSECLRLKRAHISHSVCNIGENVFKDCKSLEDISVSPQNSFFTVKNGKLQSKPADI